MNKLYSVNPSLTSNKPKSVFGSPKPTNSFTYASITNSSNSIKNTQYLDLSQNKEKCKFQIFSTENLFSQGSSCESLGNNFYNRHSDVYDKKLHLMKNFSEEKLIKKLPKYEKNLENKEKNKKNLNKISLELKPTHRTEIRALSYKISNKKFQEKYWKNKGYLKNAKIHAFHSMTTPQSKPKKLEKIETAQKVHIKDVLFDLAFSNRGTIP